MDELASVAPEKLSANMSTTDEKAFRGLAPHQIQRTLQRLVVFREKSSKEDPYQTLGTRFGLEVIFSPLTTVRGLTLREFRKRYSIPEFYEGLILIGKQPIDHFFRLLEELNLELPEGIHYIVLSESLAYYLQKYIPLKKRRTFWGDGTQESLWQILPRFQGWHLLFPGPEDRTPKLFQQLQEKNFQVTYIPVYRVEERMPAIDPYQADILVFFTSNDVEIFHQHFPKFPEEQADRIIVGFGPGTQNRLQQLGYRIDIAVPAPGLPSVLAALEKFLKAYVQQRQQKH